MHSSGAALPARQDGHGVAVAAQPFNQRSSKEAGAAGDRNPHQLATCASPSATLTRVSTRPPAMKKAITDSTAARLDPNTVTESANIAGPAMPANFSNTEKKPKYWEDLCFGIILANSD